MSDHHFSPFPSCFRPTSDHHSPVKSPPPNLSGNPNITSCLYHTHHGLFTLTWSKTTLLGHSLHLHHHHDVITSPLSLSSPSFSLHIKPFLFGKRYGSRVLCLNSNKVEIFWDFRNVKFGSRPEPKSGFYVAMIISGEMTLLAGDSVFEAYKRTEAEKPEKAQTLLQRREHVVGNRVYRTKAEFGGRAREIIIESKVADTDGDQRLIFSVDEKRVLIVKHLKWKFRGNETIKIEGVSIHVSWDVYNWLFDDDNNNNGGPGHALFMFRFENLWFDEEYEEEKTMKLKQKHRDSKVGFCGFGIKSGFEKMKLNKKGCNNNRLKTTKSSFSSSSMSSSVSSGTSSSVLDWESMEEKELESVHGFSLLVYASKR